MDLSESGVFPICPDEEDEVYQGVQRPTRREIEQAVRTLIAATGDDPDREGLRDTPGRFEGGTVWVEENSASGRDGVSSIIIGSNDWASAWAGAGSSGSRAIVN